MYFTFCVRRVIYFFNYSFKTIFSVLRELGRPFVSERVGRTVTARSSFRTASP